MRSFSLPSAGGVVSLLNDRGPPSDAEPKMTLSARDRPPHIVEAASPHTSSTDSLLKGSDRQSSSSSPATSVENSSGETKPSTWSSAMDTVEKPRLPRIEALEDPDARGFGPLGRRYVKDEPIKRSPQPIHIRPGDATLPPSATGVFPPSQWDRQANYYGMHQDLARRSSSSSDTTGSVYDAPPHSYSHAKTDRDVDAPPGLNGAASAPAASRKGGKEGGSGAITIGGKKRYPCQHPGCDKTFSTSGHAARHNRIHTGQKPYRCTFPGCKARFSRQDNSLQHYRTHILHPKGRSSQANGQVRDGSGHPVLDNMEIDGLDAEAEAKAELGRRALEDGTAIAVVHEVKDQHGRKKGETIERMVGMPRGRRESLRSNLLDDDRSTSPSSVGSGRVERQNSLPGPSHAESHHYDSGNEFWASNVARHHRLSLPHPSSSGEARYRDQGALHRDSTGYAAPAGPGAWPVPPAPYADPRATMPTLRSTASPGKRDSFDVGARHLPGPLDGDPRYEAPKSRAGSMSLHPLIRADDRGSSYVRHEPETSEYHRRSFSMGSSSRERAPPSVPSARAAAGTAASAPASQLPSTRTSQSPKSSPTSSTYSAPVDAAASALSALDRLGSSGSSGPPGAGAPLGLPASISSLSARARQHPYSSDRSTNFESSATRDTSPPAIGSRLDSGPSSFSSARSLGASIDMERKSIQPLSSSLRTGFTQEKITLPPLNPSSSSAAPRRW